VGLRSYLRSLVELPESMRAKKQVREYRFPHGYRRIYHYHVPKTGGTSLNNIFLGLCGQDSQKVYQGLVDSPNHRLFVDDYVFVAWNRELINQGDYYYAYSHIPSHRLTLPPDTFTFTCFRDPIRRLVSRYSELCFFRDNGIDHPVMATEGRCLGDSILDFVDSASPGVVFAQLGMFSKNFDLDEALSNVRRCNSVLFTESLNDDIGRLGTQIGLPIVAAHIRKGPPKEQLSAETLQTLRQALALEYQMLEAVRSDATEVFESLGLCRTVAGPCWENG